VGTRAGQRKDKNIFLNAIDKQPIWLDMTFPMPGIVTSQFMVAVARRKRDALCQLRDDFIKQGNIKVTFFHQLVVLAESVCGFDGIFHAFKSLNSASRSV